MKILRFSLSQFHKEGGRLTIRSITFVFLVIMSSRSEQFLYWKGNILKPLFNLVHVLTYSIRCQILLSTPDALYNYMQVIKNFIRNFDTKKKCIVKPAAIPHRDYLLVLVSKQLNPLLVLANQLSSASGFVEIKDCLFTGFRPFP